MYGPVAITEVRIHLRRTTRFGLLRWLVRFLLRLFGCRKGDVMGTED